MQGKEKNSFLLGQAGSSNLPSQHRPWPHTGWGNVTSTTLAPHGPPNAGGNTVRSCAERTGASPRRLPEGESPAASEAESRDAASQTKAFGRRQRGSTRGGGQYYKGITVRKNWLGARESCWATWARSDLGEGVLAPPVMRPPDDTRVLLIVWREGLGRRYSRGCRA